MFSTAYIEKFVYFLTLGIVALFYSNVYAKEIKQDIKEYIDKGGITYTRYVITKKDIKEAYVANTNVVVYLFGEKLANNISRYNRFDLVYSWTGRMVKVPKLEKGTLYNPMPTYVEKIKDYPQYIIVDLKLQFLGAYEYGKLFKSHPISSGNPKSKEPGGWIKNRATPPGMYKVLDKKIDHRSDSYPEASKENNWVKGGSPMHYGLKLGNGIYLHEGDLIGAGPRSHGCIRQLMLDAFILYFWSEVGTPVKIVKSSEASPRSLVSGLPTAN